MLTNVLISLCLKKDNVYADEDPEDDRKINWCLC